MPTITSAGIGSGLDVETIITGLLGIEQQPLIRIQQKAEQYGAQISEYGQLVSALSSFQASMASLSSISSLDANSVNSGNDDVFTASATKDAIAGTYGVEVVRLAEQHKMGSKELDSAATFGGASGDAFSIQVGVDVADTLTVDLTTALTLSQIRDAINAGTDNPGITATLINGSGTNQKLIVTSDEVGEADALSISTAGAITSTTFDFQTVNDIGGDTSLLDSEIIVDGYTINRSTNTISDVISEVTINLVSEDVGNAYTLSVGRDLGQIETSVQAFADSFNELRSAISDLRNGEIGSDGLLLSVERQVLNVINNAASGGTFSYLSEVGLTMQKDGTMDLDSSVLSAALASDFDGVSQLFAAEGQGFINRLDSLVSDWINDGGLLDSRTDSINELIEGLVDRQLFIERNLEIIETRYRVQFAALDVLVGQLQSTGTFLTQQLASLPKPNVTLK